MPRFVHSLCLGLGLVGCGRLGFDAHHAARGAPGSVRDASQDAAIHASIDAAVTSDAGRAHDGDAQASASDAATRDGDGAIDTSDGGFNPWPTDGGAPGPDVTLTSDTNLSFDNHGGRSCADGGDMVAYSVVELMATRAVLGTSPGSGCLAAGDEVLVVHLQGTSSANAHVGDFDILRVAAVNGSELRFVAPKQHSFGEGTSDDANLGVAATQQRVMLQRIPHYASLTIASGVTVHAYAWDGTRGGVMALRVAGALKIDGTLSMAGAGYAGGPATSPVNTTGQQGESIGGLGVASVSANFGGGGGGLGDGMGCRQDGSPGGGAGHVASGTSATVMSCDGLGEGVGGAMIGSSTKLLMGSGGGAGGTDNVRTDNPPGGQGGEGGGAILLFAGTLEGSGVIDASGMDGQGDAPGVECDGGDTAACWDHSGAGGGGAGGTIWITASSIASTLALDVHGGAGGNGNDVLSGNGGAASAGRVVTTP